MALPDSHSARTGRAGPDTTRCSGADDLAPGRIICGIGAWWDPLAQNVGIKRRKPLQAMRETVEVLRRLLALENVTFHGEFHHVNGIELDVVHGRREPRDVPIYIGATGPKSRATPR